MSIIPRSRPQETRDALLKEALELGHYTPRPDEVLVVSVRSYYRDTMGEPGKNDRGIYDDAAFVIGPGVFQSFNFNTDPSGYRNATSTREGMACLIPGAYKYKPGQHGLNRAGTPGYPYPAFVQAGVVSVNRDGQRERCTGWFGINIHRGGDSTTSSLGCQTFPASQWVEARDLINGLLKKHGQATFTYLLLERND